MSIGFSSDVYEVTESTGSVNVQVVKNGSNDIAVSVLLNTTAGTALGEYIIILSAWMDGQHSNTCNTLPTPLSWW